MRSYLFAFLVLPICAQELSNFNKYNIQTKYDKLKSFTIKSLDGNTVILNDGLADFALPLNNIELIQIAGNPSPFGKIIGGGIGGSVGYIGCSIGGFFIWIVAGGSTGEDFGPVSKLGIITLLSGASGAYFGARYGIKIGGNIFRGKPKTLADFRNMTNQEKRDFLANIISD